MEIIVLGVAVSSFIGLFNEINKREKFNNFMKNKSDGKFKLIDGVVQSNNELVCVNSEPNEHVIGKKTTSSSKNYHTYYTNKTIYTDGKTTLQIPFAETYEVWNKDNVSKLFVDNIFMSHNKLTSTQLFFPPNAKVMWDRKYTTVINNTEIKENLLFNNQYKYLFGTLGTATDTTDYADKDYFYNSTDNFIVKYIGDESFVTKKIRTDHYGVSNWKTGLYGLILTSSLLYMTSQTEQRRR
ncbi:putative ORFan [Tupanvirus deep ocean]|uniref:ORFan n=2 Tax=Tupanvirus TaxID=2094720 RepID=A0AC62A894_9VIRU|nr:putative ORFan [Tupanvirus deep ocean]QKU34000.1 putative ORFan [Tupanvirus deep ocean]